MDWRLLVALGLLGLAPACGGGSSEDTEGHDHDDHDHGDDDDDDGTTGSTTGNTGASTTSTPDDVDSDGDGLSDTEELGLGLDPNAADTDGDGYSDGDELFEGTDALDSESVIYKGGWPYNRNKGDIVPSNSQTMQEGEVSMDMVMIDQFGDRVHLYDFANTEGKKILVKVSAQWCGPCNDISAWLDGQNEVWTPVFGDLRDAVDNEEVYVFEILSQDTSGAPPSNIDVKEWYFAYPNPVVPVLRDEAQDQMWYTETCYPDPGNPGWAACSFPTVVVLGADMKVLWRANHNLHSYYDGLEWLNDNL